MRAVVLKVGFPGKQHQYHHKAIKMQILRLHTRLPESETLETGFVLKSPPGGSGAH